MTEETNKKKVDEMIEEHWRKVGVIKSTDEGEFVSLTIVKEQLEELGKTINTTAYIAKKLDEIATEAMSSSKLFKAVSLVLGVAFVFMTLLAYNIL